MDKNNQAQTGAKDFCNSFCHSCSFKYFVVYLLNRMNWQPYLTELILAI